jgi:hypothetical protein
MNDLAETLTTLWWIRLPQSARRLALRPVLALVDGLFIAVWPRLAAVLSPVALFLGLLLGAFHPGFDRVFSESWLMLILAVLFGVFSANLGAFFLAGFALGDFFLFHTAWAYRGSLLSGLVNVRLPLLIEYSLLGFMTTGIALATKSLLAQLRPPQSVPRDMQVLLAAGGHLGMTLLFVYLWMQVVPILIRPVFTWPGGSPSVQAMQILQQAGWPLLLVAALASLGRMGLQQLVSRHPQWQARLDAREQQLNDARPLAPLSAKVPLVARVAFTAIWSTLMLSGMLQAWWDGLVLLAVIGVLQLARARLVTPAPVLAWARRIERVPLPLRLAAGVLLTTLVARIALGPALSITNSFRPILLLTVFALFVFYLLDPLRQDGQATDA